MIRRKFFGGLLCVVFCFLLCVGFSNKKTDLYENMVDASVLIYADNDGFGSGVFIDDNVVLTAAHILQTIGACNIELNDGTILRFDDFYIDTEEDVGFIFVDADELHIAKISSLSRNIGDTVYLVGCPYDKNLKFTITKGILSHLDRDVFQWENLLQTDAEGGPGSSGGPLYDSEGQVIGICVTGPIPGGGVTLCESAKSILEAYERCKNARNN